MFHRLDFKITRDEGNFEHWRYSVLYRERLSHWPYWINVAEADYDVKKLPSNKYLVASTHRTCFFAGLYCCKLQFTFQIQSSIYRHISLNFIHSVFNGRVYFPSHWI